MKKTVKPTVSAAWKLTLVHGFVRQFTKLVDLSLRQNKFGIARILGDSMGLVKSTHVRYEIDTLAGMKAMKVTPKSGVVDENRVILYCHGGGNAIGSCKSHQGIVSALALSAKTRVINFEYRLAPEHVYPAQEEDAVKAYKALLAEGYEASNIALAGDSAGGAMVLALLLKIKKYALPTPSSGVMIFPWADFSNSLPSISTNTHKDAMLSEPLIKIFTKLGFANDNDVNHYNLKDKDLSGLPPVLVQIGSHDVLYDACQLLIQRLDEYGNTGEGQVWEGMTHGWHGYGFILAESRDATAEMARFINDHA